MASLRRMTSNVAAQIFAVAASLIDRIVLVGFLIRGWGADVFSDYSVIQSASTLLLIAELGIQIYFQNVQQAAFVAGDKAGVSTRRGHPFGRHPDHRRGVDRDPVAADAHRRNRRLPASQPDRRAHRPRGFVADGRRQSAHDHPVDHDEHLFGDRPFCVHRRHDGGGADRHHAGVDCRRHAGGRTDDASGSLSDCERRRIADLFSLGHRAPLSRLGQRAGGADAERIARRDRSSQMVQPASHWAHRVAASAGAGVRRLERLRAGHRFFLAYPHDGQPNPAGLSIRDDRGRHRDCAAGP